MVTGTRGYSQIKLFANDEHHSRVQLQIVLILSSQAIDNDADDDGMGRQSVPGWAALPLPLLRGVAVLWQPTCNYSVDAELNLPALMKTEIENLTKMDRTVVTGSAGIFCCCCSGRLGFEKAGRQLYHFVSYVVDSPSPSSAGDVQVQV